VYKKCQNFTAKTFFFKKKLLSKIDRTFIVCYKNHIMKIQNRLKKLYFPPSHPPNEKYIYIFLYYADASTINTPSRKKIVMRSRIKM